MAKFTLSPDVEEELTAIVEHIAEDARDLEQFFED
jgi:hypothetical protein